METRSPPYRCRRLLEGEISVRRWILAWLDGPNTDGLRFETENCIPYSVNWHRRKERVSYASNDIEIVEYKSLERLFNTKYFEAGKTWCISFSVCVERFRDFQGRL